MTTKQIIKNTGIKSKQVLKFAKDRTLTKTPKRFVKIRNIFLIVAGVGGAILTAPVSLPAWLIALAPYMVWLGNTAAGVAHVQK